MKNGRRRVLLVSYWVPPRKAIGTIRSSYILKYLPRFGWDVDVFTARFDSEVNGAGARWTQTGYWDFKRAIKRVARIGDRSTSAVLNLEGFHYGGKPNLAGRAVRLTADLVTYPDEYVGWIPFAVPSLRRTLKAGAYDAILTSSPPVTTNVIAAIAHRNVPWVADLRDLWAEDDSRERSPLQRLADDRLERAALSRATVLTASSELSAQRFRTRYPGKTCDSITTGFDEDEWQGIEFASESRCSLVYAGNFYGGRRDPRLLFAALREMLSEGRASASDVQVDVYAGPEPWLVRMIAEYGLDNVVRLRGQIDRPAVLAAERKADRLLVFCWDGATAEGVVPGKLFEYFGARRPILAIGGTQKSAVCDLLSETGAGVQCRTVEEVKSAVLAAIGEHGERQRAIPLHAVCAYTAERCAMEFGRVLDSIVSADSQSRRHAREQTTMRR
jgi:glycosyltransferase involved in cell wall biosynthesis